MGLYHLLYSQVLVQGPIEHQDTHLGFALVVVFLFTLKRKPKLWPLIVPLIALSLFATGYIMVEFSELEWRIGNPNTADTIVGVILIIVAMEATRQSFGWPLFLLALLLIGYTFLGQYLPAPFWHYPLPVKAVIANFATNFDIGMWGIYIGISANFVFLFLLFGGLLQASGAARFF